MYNFAYAQSPLVGFKKVQEIKLLESSRDDVVKLLADDSLSFSNSSYHSQSFFTDKAVIKISYSNGRCSDESEDWNVSEWKGDKNSFYSEGFSPDKRYWN